ncbi:CDP-glycerol glycerophosphotransferase family protein [Cronobacter universalis]|uniref:Beta-1,3-glucosyltransferase n=1 Tax=Cronobacter universalis NCTC 9529 TaxID=1074000 RepID=A0AAC9EVR3_9ENTR|nr:CDP-glycerol glycerophosphotransferase family protein [Cronobacter universalis]ALB53704.1 beta-1,3-glucosyltransferase [Cronobacter universalis NCTC 9529]STC99637.1 putative glycosyl transferase [Cronobacter universalis NCTC 9529]
MFNNKLRKLVRDPKLFFSDMAANQARKLGKFRFKKEDGQYNYTVVSAVYNVSAFLDDYFQSFVNQRLNFKKHIQLILVDDGSTDNSAEIIKRWQKKYPNNITYINQENAGQSAARNNGLQHVTTEWVTFIDPDDFVDANYFYNLDSFLYQHQDKDIKMVGCNIIMFYEAKNQYKSAHPLGFKFKNGNQLVPLGSMEKEIQLSASTAFFRADIISTKQIFFDAKVKPNFEDAHFVARYLQGDKSGHAAFLEHSKYYYRKREDGSSTLDTSWTKKERFLNVPEYGYLNVLKSYHEKEGVVPVNIQRTIIYEIVWYLKWLTNHGERSAFLTSDEKRKFISKLKEIFVFLDKNTIMNFELAGAWFFQKVAMLSFFKGLQPDAQIVYVEKYDHYKHMVQLRYFTSTLNLEQILLDGKDIVPAYVKTIRHDFMDETLILERRLWVALGDAQQINISVSHLPTRLSLGGKQYKEGLKTTDINKYFLALMPKYEKKKEYHQAWIFMDRDTQADDNAEHLYRYVRDNYPQKNIFFVLQKDSHDWARLEQEGFRLLEFGSHEHKLALGSCSKVISSHANRYVTNYLGPKMLAGKHYVFLQHGVTKDDISGWMNSKENIDCFITTSPYEYQSIYEDGSRYYYTKKEVVLTGFPRHDKLVVNNTNERLVVIMPTWRQTIVGPVTGDGEARALNPLFMQTDFAKSWYSILHSPLLKKYAERYAFKVAFFPHANIQPYLSHFEVPDYIEVITHSQGSIQDVFNRASMMITDYSSVAFELAVQNKPVIYYQFDAKECFSGAHIYSKGYFDYRKHGFGPVVETEKELFKELNTLLKNDAVPSAKILKRISETFPFRDGNNCERTYQAIAALDAPLPEGFADKEIYQQYAKHAAVARRWALAEKRWQAYLALALTQDEDAHGCAGLAEALRKQGKTVEARSVINGWHARHPKQRHTALSASLALVEMAEHHWQQAALCWQEAGEATLDNNRYCYCLYRSGQAAMLDTLCKKARPATGFSYARFCLLLAKQKWAEGIAYVEAQGVDVTSAESLENKLLITLSYCYQQLNKLNDAHQCLVKYEKYIENDPQCRLKIARLAFLRHNWEKILTQLNKASADIDHLPDEHLYYYCVALLRTGKFKELYTLFGMLSEALRSDVRFLKIYAQACLALKKPGEAIAIFETQDKPDDEFCLIGAEALKEAGRFNQALLVVRNKLSRYNQNAWMLRCELAQLCEDWDDAYECWLSLLRHYPQNMPASAAEKLQNLRLLREFSVKSDA